MVNANTGEFVVNKDFYPGNDKDPQNTTLLVDLIMSSSAIPIFFPH